MPRPTSRTDLRATADALRAEAKRVRDEAEVKALALEESARLIEQAAGLTISKQRSTVSSNVDLDLAGRPEHVRTAANRTRRQSESKQLQLAANRSDGDIAAELRVGRSTVNAWHAGRLSIPRHHANYLLVHYNIPLAAWSKLGE